MTKLQEDVNPIIEEIANKEYIGRMIIAGRTPDGKSDVLAYFPTGRSSGSKARFLALKNDGSIKTEPSSGAKEGQGNPALIYYNAIRLLDNGGIVFTNGAQTDLIAETYARINDRSIDPKELLEASFEDASKMMDYFDVEKQQMIRIDITSFEPDKPNYTPRISGVLGEDNVGMAIAFCEDGEVKREYFDLSLIGGEARALPTYAGENVPSGVVIPRFKGEPLTFPVVGETAEEFAQAIFNSLGPKEGEGVVSPGADFRVGVAAIFRDRETNTLDYHVINANKPKGE